MANAKNIATVTPARLPRPGRPTLEDAQAIPDRIVAAATALFLKAGFEATSMDMVARHANVSKRTLYDRFHSKEEVFLAAVDAITVKRLRKLQKIKVGARTLRKALEEVASKSIECLATPEFAGFERIIAAGARRFPDLAQERSGRGMPYLDDLVSQTIRRYSPFDAMQEETVSLHAQVFVAMAILPSLRAAMFAEDAHNGSDSKFIDQAIAIFVRGTALEVPKTLPNSPKGCGTAAATTTQPTPDTTRGRILLAAMRRFSLASYDDTGLRDIAADAEVDAAYVHRSFGSKEALFVEALEAASDQKRFETITSSPNLPKAIATLFAHRQDPNESNSIHPLDIMIRSLCSPTALAALRGKLQSDLITPLAAKLDHPSGVRASMLSAVLIGIGIATTILQMPGLGQEEKAAEAILENVVAAIMTGRT